MITETLESYAKNENKTDALNEIIDAINKHDNFFMTSTSMPSDIDGTSDQKKLFGCNVTRYIQLLGIPLKTASVTAAKAAAVVL